MQPEFADKYGLKLCPGAAHLITAWDIGDDLLARLLRNTTHMALGTPAGLHGKRLKAMLKIAHKILVP